MKFAQQHAALAAAKAMHTFTLDNQRAAHEFQKGAIVRALNEAHEATRALREAETWRLVEALIEALPKCTRCHSRTATKAWVRGASRYCDDCDSRIGWVRATAPDYPRAAPLRALLAARDAKETK